MALTPKPKAPNINSIVATVAGITILVVLALAASLQPLRDHLRTQYGLKKPAYYDNLPADTDANRIAVTKLLAEREHEKAMLQESLKPAPQSELQHGRTTDLSMGYIITDPPQDPPRSLADSYEIKRDLCHMRWGLLGRAFNLCKNVDQSINAAEHYANDVENYWVSRLLPAASTAPE